jgi:hypothetical protein
MPGHIVVAGHGHVFASQTSPGYSLQLVRDLGPFLISLCQSQRPARREQPSKPPVPAMAGSPPDSGDAITRREAHKVFATLGISSRKERHEALPELGQLALPA